MRLMILFLLLGCNILAQVNIDFEDTQLNEWNQSENHWIISNENPIDGFYSLRHDFDSQERNTDAISYQIADIYPDQKMEWCFDLKYSYNPSALNNWQVYLLSKGDYEEMNKDGVEEAFILGVNFNTSDDIIRLWKRNETSTEIIVESNYNWQDSVHAGDVVQLKVIHDLNGKWQIFIRNKTISQPLIIIGEGVAVPSNGMNYFGLSYTYTSGADRNLWFDNFYHGPFREDTLPPAINQIKFLSDSSIAINFNEQPELSSAFNPYNYEIIEDSVHPELVYFNNYYQTNVELIFDKKFSNKKKYTLSMQNILDTNKNVLNADTIIYYYIAEPGDIVINEIMADPYPPVGLPNHEYIELYNNLEIPVDLARWKFLVEEDSFYFTDKILEPKSYIILCNEEATEIFSSFGGTMGFNGFRSISNSGIPLTLISPENIIISSVSFKTDWYTNPDKDNGGWSLEKIDPENICSRELNWKASISPAGGTPGRLNAVYKQNPDTIAPIVDFISQVSDRQIKLYFSEHIERSDLSIFDFWLSDTGNPYSFFWVEEDKTIDLVFNEKLLNEHHYYLILNNLKDYCGNVMNQDKLLFDVYDAVYQDLIFTEIMSDPSPPVSLPEAEYVEIYNRSGFEIELTGMRLKTGSGFGIIRRGRLLPKNYAVLISPNDQEKFKSGNIKYIECHSIKNIKNDGDTLSLYSTDGVLIDNVSFDKNWYDNEYKDEGGWSLEMIDLLNFCGNDENWTASGSNRGGTPGSVNSIDSVVIDTDAPELEKIFVINEQTIGVCFNETLDSITAMHNHLYYADNGLAYPERIGFRQPDYSSVRLVFNEEVNKELIYTLEISTEIKDCVGNTLDKALTGRFALPDPTPEDIVINEVLFNPYPDGTDFVEIYNNSLSTIDLSCLLLAKGDDSLSGISEYYRISESSKLFFPGEYIVLSEDINKVEKFYSTQQMQSFVTMNKFPNYGDEHGVVVLYDNNNRTIDRFEYDESMHFSFLTDMEGVSLERLNFGIESKWFSASELSGFATPGYKNSQFISTTSNENNIQVKKEVFSPNLDGIDDQLILTYNFEKPGNVLNIKIFNAAGQQIRYLSNTDFTGSEGVITWDGLTEENRMAPMGIYIVYVETFYPNGKAEVIKFPCVLALPD